MDCSRDQVVFYLLHRLRATSRDQVVLQRLQRLDGTRKITLKNTLKTQKNTEKTLSRGGKQKETKKTGKNQKKYLFVTLQGTFQGNYIFLERVSGGGPSTPTAQKL
uniref:Uncharacterized protein n=1 Tax=Eutreptiella gymnastica TaxID=73025 RepID=A0A7S1HT30_9EUGL